MEPSLINASKDIVATYYEGKVIAHQLTGKMDGYNEKSKYPENFFSFDDFLESLLRIKFNADKLKYTAYIDNLHL